MTGAAGYIAPRHLKAIRESGNQLTLALDPEAPKALGSLINYFPNTHYTNCSEDFEERLRSYAESSEAKIDYVSICSPTEFHAAQIRTALKCGAHVVCEKPIVVEPLDLSALSDLEQESGRSVYTVLQLRSHESLKLLRHELIRDQGRDRKSVVATIITARGPWYWQSWKADQQKSGGLAMNIGVHLFDLLIWLFGKVDRSRLHLKTQSRMAGYLEMERASVQWYLSIDPADLPAASQASNESVVRSLVINGNEISFADGLANLHRQVYEDILAGRGMGIEDARPSIEFVNSLRHAVLSNTNGDGHPRLYS
jgi:UDP-N-acetyl-2-amino-2-deoxyglucuronate dehydrogenase